MIKFSNIYRFEPDNWKKNESGIISSDEKLRQIEKELENGKFLVAEHWHYRGASCPTRFVVEDFDEFVEYLKEKAIAGDIVDLFDLSDAWKNKKVLLTGKCPDELGEIPEKGAY
jgi:hypothetical protein